MNDTILSTLQLSDINKAERIQQIITSLPNRFTQKILKKILGDASDEAFLKNILTDIRETEDDKEFHDKLSKLIRWISIKKIDLPQHAMTEIQSIFQEQQKILHAKEIIFAALKRAEKPCYLNEARIKNILKVFKHLYLCNSLNEATADLFIFQMDATLFFMASPECFIFLYENGLHQDPVLLPSLQMHKSSISINKITQAIKFLHENSLLSHPAIRTTLGKIIACEYPHEKAKMLHLLHDQNASLLTTKNIKRLIKIRYAGIVQQLLAIRGKLVPQIIQADLDLLLSHPELSVLNSQVLNLLNHHLLTAEIFTALTRSPNKSRIFDYVEDNDLARAITLLKEYDSKLFFQHLDRIVSYHRYAYDLAQGIRTLSKAQLLNIHGRCVVEMISASSGPSILANLLAEMHTEKLLDNEVFFDKIIALSQQNLFFLWTINTLYKSCLLTFEALEWLNKHPFESAGKLYKIIRWLSEDKILDFNILNKLLLCQDIPKLYSILCGMDVTADNLPTILIIFSKAKVEDTIEHILQMINERMEQELLSFRAFPYGKRASIFAGCEQSPPTTPEKSCAP